MAPANSNTPSTQKTSAQPLGIATGGLISRRSFVVTSAEATEPGMELVESMPLMTLDFGLWTLDSRSPPQSSPLARFKEPAQRNSVRLIGAQLNRINAGRAE